jgi:hypothetical protein
MANWLGACPQSLIGIVHFSEAFRIARYSILNMASSVQNVERFFVTFSNWQFKDSTWKNTDYTPIATEL